MSTRAENADLLRRAAERAGKIDLPGLVGEALTNLFRGEVQFAERLNGYDTTDFGSKVLAAARSVLEVEP